MQALTNLPNETIDKIIFYTGDVELSILLKRSDYITRKIYNFYKFSNDPCKWNVYKNNKKFVNWVCDNDDMYLRNTISFCSLEMLKFVFKKKSFELQTKMELVMYWVVRKNRVDLLEYICKNNFVLLYSDLAISEIIGFRKLPIFIILERETNLVTNNIADILDWCVHFHLEKSVVFVQYLFPRIKIVFSEQNLADIVKYDYLAMFKLIYTLDLVNPGFCFAKAIITTMEQDSEKIFSWGLKNVDVFYVCGGYHGCEFRHFHDQLESIRNYVN